MARTIYCTYLIWRTIQIWLTSLQAHSKTTAIIKGVIWLINSLMNVNLPITKLIFIAVILIKAFLQAFTVLMAYVTNGTVIINLTKVITNSMIFMTILTFCTMLVNLTRQLTLSTFDTNESFWTSVFFVAATSHAVLHSRNVDHIWTQNMIVWLTKLLLKTCI